MNVYNMHSVLCEALDLDIDECSNSPRPCAELCANNEGSYTCSCTDNSRTVTADGDCVGNKIKIWLLEE